MKKLIIAAFALLAVPAYAAVGVIASPVATSNLIAKTNTSSLYAVNIVSGGSAGYVMVFDSATVPADGTVTPTVCLPIAANTGLDINFRAEPMRFVNGITIVFSTTGCFTKTASATAFIAGSVM